MISIRESATELDRLENLLKTVTTVWNRQKLDSQIADRLENNQPFSILLVRLSNLKQLEGGYSRTVIEGAMKALLQRFTAMIGEETLLGRWNDENFAAILDIE